MWTLSGTQFLFNGHYTNNAVKTIFFHHDRSRTTVCSLKSLKIQMILPDVSFNGSLKIAEI